MFLKPFSLRHRILSNFKLNPVVRGFILSETIFWSGVNLVAPIFGVFVVNELSDGSVEAAAISISVYMIARVIAELVFGNHLNNTRDQVKLVYAIVGILMVALFHLLFVWASMVWEVYVLQALVGLGFGIVSPAKFALFSEHIDRGKESSEWSVYDAANFAGMAITAAVGGFVAEEYGFDALFIVTTIVIGLGCIPYFYIFSKLKNEDSHPPSTY